MPRNNIKWQSRGSDRWKAKYRDKIAEAAVSNAKLRKSFIQAANLLLDEECKDWVMEEHGLSEASYRKKRLDRVSNDVAVYRRTNNIPLPGRFRYPDTTSQPPRGPPPPLPPRGGSLSLLEGIVPPPRVDSLSPLEGIVPPPRGDSLSPLEGIVPPPRDIPSSLSNND